MRLYLGIKKAPYEIIPQYDEFSRLYDDLHDDEDDINDNGDKMKTEETTPMNELVEKIEEGTIPPNDPTTSKYQEILSYPKDIIFMQSLGFSREGEVRKKGQGITNN